MEEMSSTKREQVESMRTKVFVNRTLNMKKINYIGLDMDHTLIRYKSENFEALTHSTLCKKLTEQLQYPKEVLSLKFSYEYAIRGLVIDKERGNLLKLSRHGAIRNSRHGIHKLDYATQQKIYKSTYIDLSDPEYEAIDTSFSIAYAALFAQLVDLKDNHPECMGLPDYVIMAQDLNRMLDQSHRDGTLKTVVRDHLSDYIIKDPKVVEGIRRYRKHGKKFFILTNSDFYYTKLLLDFAINPFLEEGETWLDLFEYVITFAQKPRFFYDSLPMLKVNPETGDMRNLGTEKIIPGVYQGGSASRLTQDLGIRPDEILYLGDHIYGDILRLKKDCAWRTALIVEELEDEIENDLSAKVFQDQINALMSRKIPLERKLDALMSERIENGLEDKKEETNELMDQIHQLDAKLAPLIKEQNRSYNHYWGELMRAGIEESYFAYQVERFACIYMSKLSDLLSLSPRTYFRSHKHLMPHDL